MRLNQLLVSTLSVSLWPIVGFAAAAGGASSSTTVYHPLSGDVQFVERQLTVEQDLHSSSNRFTVPYRSSSSSLQNVLHVKYPSFLSHESVLKVVQPTKDGRKRIVKTNEWPYCVHGHLSMQDGSAQGAEGFYHGSGVLVSPHHVLTCAHNVFNVGGKKGWRKNITFKPAINGELAPFGEIPVAGMYVYNTWIQSGDDNFDIALLTLTQSIGERTGYCGLLCLDDSSLEHEKVEITGYPGDKPDGEMWTMFHKLKAIRPERLIYEIDTYPGQSGSAVWVSKMGRPYVVGIHTTGETKVNSGTRLSLSKFNKLIQLISETGEMRTNIGVALSDVVGTQNPQHQFKLGNNYYYGSGGVEQDYTKAAEWYKKAAEQGHADAQYQLGNCYFNEQGVPQNYEQAKFWYERAANRGHADAQFTLGKYLFEKGVTTDRAQAIEWYKKAAMQGHVDAQYELAVCYEEGYGIEPSEIEAAKFYAKSAMQGHATAQFKIGVCYETGTGVPQSDEKAAGWYWKSAEQDCSTAQCRLGNCFITGTGVTKNGGKAIVWYKKAADSGEPAAKYILSMMYFNGLLDIASKEEDEKAIEWCRTAQLLSCEAQYILGGMYADGKGVSQNRMEADRWFQKCMETREEERNYEKNKLTLMLLKTFGVKLDDIERRSKKDEQWEQTKAIRLRADELMESLAQLFGKSITKKRLYSVDLYDLGIRYEFGNGVPQNYTKATELYKEAKKEGYDEARHRLRCCTMKKYIHHIAPPALIVFFSYVCFYLICNFALSETNDFCRTVDGTLASVYEYGREQGRMIGSYLFGSEQENVSSPLR